TENLRSFGFAPVACDGHAHRIAFIFGAGTTRPCVTTVLLIFAVYRSGRQLDDSREVTFLLQREGDSGSSSAVRPPLCQSEAPFSRERPRQLGIDIAVLFSGNSYHTLDESRTRLQRVFYQPCLITMFLQDRQCGSEIFSKVGISHRFYMLLIFLQRGLMILQGEIHVGAIELMAG